MTFRKLAAASLLFTGLSSLLTAGCSTGAKTKTPAAVLLALRFTGV